MPCAGEGESEGIGQFFRQGDGSFLQRIFTLLLLALVGSSAPTVLHAQDGLCAVVSIQIQQKVSLERQAFTAELDINNGLTTSSITNVGVNVVFTDASGAPVVATTDPNSASASFFLRQDSLSGINATDGSGIVGPSTNAVMRWLIIPAPGSGGTNPNGALYWVGATLTYTLDGQTQTVNVNPASITVVPQPSLQLDYFLPNDVYGDDPFTAPVEPSIPFTLGVRVTNSGAGTAHSLTIASAQPKIIDNQQGLLIGFQLIDSYVDNQPTANTLLLNFGDIGPQQARIGRWDMETTLSGQFVDFSATFTHADSLGGALTSLITGVNTHTLIHDVLVDLPGRDDVRDFLARDGDVARVYESDNVDDDVVDASASATINSTSISFQPVSGLAYVQGPDPFAGQLASIATTRSDGKVLPASNVWFSKTRDQGGNWVYYINLFDTNSTGHYTLQGGSATPTGSLAGSVFDDANANGVRDAGENGMSGVSVHLHGATATATVDIDAISDALGNYQFSNLSAGTYSLSVAAVAQFSDGIALPGTAGGTGSATGIQNISLSNSSAGTGYQFPKVPQASAPIADFALTGFSLNASTIFVGDNATLTATLSNLGPAADSASVVFTIPAGTTIVASAPSIGTFDPSARVWHTTALAAGVNATLSITLQAQTAGAVTLAAQAMADAGATDPGTQNNSAAATLTINQAQANITLAKSAPANVTAGAPLAYAIALGNSGPGASGSSLTVVDTLPAGVTFNNAVPGPGVAAVTCAGTTSLVCSIALSAPLPASTPSGAAAFTINTTAPNTGGSITNFASVDSTGGGNPPPPGIACVPVTSCGSATTAVNAVASITLAKSGPASALAYSTVPYTIALGNSGAAASGTTITVADALPAGMNFVSAVPGKNVAGVTCAGAPMTVCTVTLTTVLAPGAANGAAAFTINATAPSRTGIAINYASVDATGGTNAPPPGAVCMPAASCSSATTTINPAPYITLSKAGPANATTLGAAAYVISLGNSGEAASGTTLTVVDLLPTGMNFVSAIPGIDVAAVTCSGTTSLTCSVTLGSALPGASSNGTASFTINTTAPTTAGVITNYASVDPSGGANPPQPGSNCAPATSCGSAQTSVVPGNATNLILDKSAPSSAIEGSAFTYTLRVGNSGSAPSGKTATISELLPAGVTVSAASAGIGVQSVDCGVLPITGDGTTPRNCTLKLKSTIAANTATSAVGAAVFTISAKATALGATTNYASVDPSGGSSPPAASATCSTTSCASAATTILSRSAANLTLVKSGKGNVGRNTPYTYSLSLGNSGAAASGSTVTIADVLPAGVTVTKADSGAGVAAVDCGTLPKSGDGRSPMTCSVTLDAPIPSHAVNGSVVVVLTATASATGKLTNYASVDATGGTQPPAPGVNCASATACSSWTTQVHSGGPAAATPTNKSAEISASPATASVPLDTRALLFALGLLLLGVGVNKIRSRQR